MATRCTSRQFDLEGEQAHRQVRATLEAVHARSARIHLLVAAPRAQDALARAEAHFLECLKAVREADSEEGRIQCARALLELNRLRASSRP